ncbi:hypothetical protein [Streptomyces sp. NRRL F-5755]|uniref:nSTAND1 domain-containing NTPase n=1 Tax=Streptomyces sp. NRRL F-5755 TaxID=1519475 RepID=UPI0006ADC003|nr:hypothetical protein [Streptomyces sp. NRRL F-5755]
MARNTADQAPYPGPARYETGDQDRFFGRDDHIQQLMVMVRERPLPVLAGRPAVVSPRSCAPD